jgi:signal transduction histidine kinase/CheY-like chemotaxis protein
MLSLGDTASSLLEVIREGNPVFSKPALVPGYKDVDGVNVDLDAWDVLESDLESNDHREHAGKPASMIHYPIFGEASGTHNDPGHSPSRVVGFLSATIHFSELLANVLPKGSNGTVVVFDNPCSQSFTFELNGPEARYLGVGDRHDKKYESKVMAASLSDMGSYSSRSYAATWIPLSTEYCQFSIRVYPSQVVEQNFVTLYPVLFTVLIAFTFAVEIACFYWFTRIVERRQRNLLDIARERSRKLEDANIRLEHANHKVVESAALQLRHFACMSHEIRTPLNAILGMASVLIDMPLNLSQKEPVGIIVSSGDLLRSIVDDVLDYAKLESGNVDLTVKANSLQDVLSFVVSSVEAKVVAMPNRPRIRTFYDVNLPETVYTDSLRLRQILINLLSNVVKFSKQNGLVDLTVCSGPRDVQTRHADKDLPSSDGTSVSMIKFIVKDYGRGIRSENFQRIFQPFLQDTTEKGTGAAEGTGLGLAITKKLVERLGGSISVDSVFGEYSEFEVQLPCFLEDNGSEHARHAGTSFSCTKPSEFALASNVTILCVDDDIQRCAHLTRVFDYYQVMYRCFHSMWEMEGALKGINSAASGDRLVCLCHIDMVESSVYERIAFEMPFLIMIAFGISTRSESVTEAPDHIPSLTKLLPAVMMRELGAAYNRSTQDTSGRSPSTKDLCDEPSIDSHCAAQCSVQSLRILIAEDNKVNQKVLCRILERLSVTDYEIVEDGRQAVDREAAKEFDVVLMDLQMPVMDGLEACRLICSRRPTDEATHPVACVVFLTASVSAAIKASCKEAGAIDFVSKPCNVSIVQECLEKVVSRSQRKPQKASGIDAGLLYPGEVAGVSTC